MKTLTESINIEIREVLQDLLPRNTCRQHVQDIGHPDPHSPNARSAAALFRVHRDTVSKLCHDSASWKPSDEQKIPTPSLGVQRLRDQCRRNVNDDTLIP